MGEAQWVGQSSEHWRVYVQDVHQEWVLVYSTSGEDMARRIVADYEKDGYAARASHLVIEEIPLETQT